MGNRAIITSVGSVPTRAGIYLHWNGGAESVLAFLEASKQLGIRNPISDDTYCFSRMAQVIGNWMKGTLSLGAGPIDNMDSGDNGVYQVSAKWEIETRSREGEKTVAELNGDERKIYDQILAECLAVNKPFFGE